MGEEAAAEEEEAAAAAPPAAAPPAAAPPAAAPAAPAPAALKTQAERIKTELDLAPELTTAGAIIAAANEAMGLAAEGPLPQQVARLIEMIF